MRDCLYASSHSPTVATVSQSSSECPALCGDDVLDGGSPAGAETLACPGSSLAAGSFSVAAAPAGGSMGRGTHRATAAQQQPRHQQRPRTRVSAPTAVRTMEARAAGLRAAGGLSEAARGGSVDARGVRGTGANSNALHSRRKPAGRGPVDAGGGWGAGRRDWVGAFAALRPLACPDLGGAWSQPRLLLTGGARGTHLHQSKRDRGGCSRDTGIPANASPPWAGSKKEEAQELPAATRGCPWQNPSGGEVVAPEGGVRVGHGFQETLPRLGGSNLQCCLASATSARQSPGPAPPKVGAHLLVLSSRTPGYTGFPGTCYAASYTLGLAGRAENAVLFRPSRHLQGVGSVSLSLACKECSSPAA